MVLTLYGFNWSADENRILNVKLVSVDKNKINNSISQIKKFRKWLGLQQQWIR